MYSSSRARTMPSAVADGPGRLQRLPGIGQLAPGAVVVGVADPDVEVAR